MKKIIVPCDFSEPAIEAFKFALDLAKKSKGSVLVVKVIDIPIAYEASFGMPTYAFNLGMSKELEEDARKSFDKLQQKFGKGYKKVKFFVVHGPASMMIRDFIEEKKPDLVVMGTHGASGLQEFFVGSNTEKIVRFSKVPVFAIRKAIPVSKIKNIVFPTSLELNQTDFIKKLMVVQAFFKAKLHILFLNTPFNFVRDNELKDYAKHFEFRNYTLNIRNDRYEPDGIIAFTNEVKADMLAMATHGRKGLSHFVSGSITESVVNHVKCPVWTYTIKSKK
ncbi:MAG: universal stress protein [Cyclobacteriaceae bacterium]